MVLFCGCHWSWLLVKASLRLRGLLLRVLGPSHVMLASWKRFKNMEAGTPCLIHLGLRSLMLSPVHSPRDQGQPCELEGPVWACVVTVGGMHGIFTAEPCEGQASYFCGHDEIPNRSYGRYILSHGFREILFSAMLGRAWQRVQEVVTSYGGNQEQASPSPCLRFQLPKGYPASESLHQLGIQCRQREPVGDTEIQTIISSRPQPPQRKGPSSSIQGGCLSNKVLSDATVSCFLTCIYTGLSSM